MSKSLRVAILMGSDSDWSVMEACAAQLRAFGVEAHVEVASAHRSPRRVHEFAAGAEAAGFEVVIAAAGMSAALAGTIAANTVLPVIGVPLEGGAVGGLDALLSTVQMPPGVPVAGVALGTAGAKNAALLAVQILGAKDPALREAFRRFKADQALAVEQKNAALQTKRASMPSKPGKA
ncbi:MAG: 5-(carboxyamino)imidazole ribonucleotide mutase [Phycisphaerales bacterium]|nr:5-(carboxyamino)imidazole ribonucleotide mutase [Phycisphaerales bacterium]